MFIAKMLRNAATSIAAAALLVGVQTAAQAEEPDELKFAIILSAGIESGWDGTLIQALERVKAEQPNGLAALKRDGYPPEHRALLEAFADVERGQAGVVGHQARAFAGGGGRGRRLDCIVPVLAAHWDLSSSGFALGRINASTLPRSWLMPVARLTSA